MDEKEYTVCILVERDVSVLATSEEEAKKAVEEMYNSGDSCAELGDPRFIILREDP